MTNCALDGQGPGPEEQVGRAQGRLKAADETPHRNAMGTGPYTLEIVATRPAHGIQRRNPNWWGQDGRQRDGDRLHPIKSAATRIAALLSGEVDMMLDPRPRTWAACVPAGFEVVDGVETAPSSRAWTRFPDGAGQQHQGQEPLKDLQVRRPCTRRRYQHHLAQHHAGPGQNPRVRWLRRRWLAGPRRFKRIYDVDAAKKYWLTLAMPAVFPYLPRSVLLPEQSLHQRQKRFARQSITIMGARWREAKLRTLPLVNYFPMIQRYETSIYMLGWGSANLRRAVQPAVPGTQRVGRERWRQLQRGPLQQPAHGLPGGPHQAKPDAPVRAAC